MSLVGSFLSRKLEVKDFSLCFRNFTSGCVTDRDPGRLGDLFYIQREQFADFSENAT